MLRLLLVEMFKKYSSSLREKKKSDKGYKQTKERKNPNNYRFYKNIHKHKVNANLL